MLQVLMQDIRTIETEAVVAGLFEDVRPLKGAAGRLDWVLCGALSRLVLEGRVRGAVGDIALLTSAGKLAAPKIFLVGLGSSVSRTPETMRSAARGMVESLAGAGVTRAAADLFPPDGPTDDAVLQAVREGIAERRGGHAVGITLITPDQDLFTRLSRMAQS